MNYRKFLSSTLIFAAIVFISGHILNSEALSGFFRKENLLSSVAIIGSSLAAGAAIAALQHWVEKKREKENVE